MFKYLKHWCLLFILSTPVISIYSQTETETNKQTLDSLYIAETENRPKERPKVLHAEPLYIDLIRDLGARKGEKEWNFGFGITDKRNFDEYLALVEYEWAPIDRLGLEVELPFSIFEPTENGTQAPGSKLQSLKLAAQYTFWVSEEYKTSLAIGYLHEFELTEFRNYSSSRFYAGNIYNPFFIAAKRWGNNFHTLLYTGPQFFEHFNSNSWETIWQFNTNFHYMISGTRNFLGIELNKELNDAGKFDMVMRPQMRVGVTDNLLIGIVTGIPISRDNERLSTFLRIIYEPGH